VVTDFPSPWPCLREKKRKFENCHEKKEKGKRGTHPLIEGDSPSDREGKKARRNRGKASSSGLIAINNGLINGMIASNKLGEKLVGLGHVGTYMENHEAKQEQKESERERKRNQ